MKKINFFQSNVFIDGVAFLICFLFTLAGSLVSLNRYWQYEVFFYDFGIFDQAIWKISRLEAPIIDHLVIGGKWIFADHFNPSIFFLSPIYWFTNRSDALLIAQSIAVGLSALVIYLAGREVIKNRFQALSILICYVLFLGIQNAVISDIHEATFMVLPLSLIFWAFAKNNARLFFLFLLVTLGFKESSFLLGIGIAVVLFFLRPEWRKISIATAIISLLWGLVSIKIVIPYFAQDTYGYTAFSSSMDNPLSLFFDDSLKRQTLFYSFSSFGFLPLLAPAFWPLFLQDFIARFGLIATTRWGLGLHYSAQLSVLLAVSSFFSLEFLKKKIGAQKINIICIVLIVHAIILYRFILHGPFALAYNKFFYMHTNDFTYLETLIKKIPENASVMTQNNIAVRFTHQPVFLLRNQYSLFSPDYILIDLREGQNLNNFFGTKDVKKLLEELKNDPEYQVIHKAKEQFIFQKKKTQ